MGDSVRGTVLSPVQDGPVRPGLDSPGTPLGARSHELRVWSGQRPGGCEWRLLGSGEARAGRVTVAYIRNGGRAVAIADPGLETRMESVNCAPRGAMSRHGRTPMERPARRHVPAHAQDTTDACGRTPRMPPARSARMGPHRARQDHVESFQDRGPGTSRYAGPPGRGRKQPATAQGVRAPGKPRQDRAGRWRLTPEAAILGPP